MLLTICEGDLWKAIELEEKITSEWWNWYEVYLRGGPRTIDLMTPEGRALRRKRRKERG